MILLDTNVVSGLMAQDAAVIAWLDRQPMESLWLPSVVLFETEFGLALLPEGRRRDALTAAFGALLREDLDGRVAGFDAAAARAAAELAAQRRREGTSVDVRDTLIAGIAVARRATLATRNLRHFADLPTPVVSPWAAAG
jgi:predicted nucleic acid-binding protein